MTRPGRSARADLDDPPDRRARRGPGRRSAGIAGQQAEPAGAQTDLAGRFLAGGVQDAARRRRRPASGRPRPGAGAWTCRSPARRRPGPASPGTSPAAEHAVELGDARRAARGRSASAIGASPAAWAPHPPGHAARAAPRAGAGSRTTVSTRLFHSPHARHWPSQRRKDSRAASGRRSGSAAAPRLGRRSERRGHRASTGVRGCSARWMSSPASGSLSTTIVEPGSYLPSRRCSASTSSIMFWMTRRSGRAPYATS